MTIKPFLSDQGVISCLIITQNNQAVLIDPSFDMAQSIVRELKQNSIELKYILETHTHADFFSSRKLFKTLYPKSQIGLSKNSPTKDNELKIADGQIINLDEVSIVAWQTNGHTNESLIFVLEEDSGKTDQAMDQQKAPILSSPSSSVSNTNSNPNQKYIFTGDTLLIGGTGRSDFQLGDSQSLYQSLQRILTLPDSAVIYPGHNYQKQTKTILGVEKITNSRLKLAIENKHEEFIKVMESHKPPKPELFEESLIWNSL